VHVEHAIDGHLEHTVTEELEALVVLQAHDRASLRWGNRLPGEMGDDAAAEPRSCAFSMGRKMGRSDAVRNVPALMECTLSSSGSAISRRVDLASRYEMIPVTGLWISASTSSRGCLKSFTDAELA
jgi:hypothetical protein